MNLGHCIELRSLCYWIFMFSNNPRSNRLYWDGIVALLTEAVDKLTKLERVKFAICLSGDAALLTKQLNDVDWKQMEDILGRIVRLQAVEVTIEHRGGNQAGDDLAWKAIAAKLPTLASKGTLRRGR